MGILSQAMIPRRTVVAALSAAVFTGSLLLGGDVLAKKTTITWMYWVTTQQDKDYAIRTAGKFEKANPDIKVKIIHQQWGMEADYVSKILTLSAANVAPDVISLPFNLLPRLAENNILTELSPYISRDKSVKLDDWMPVSQKAVKWKNKLWGLPWHGSTWWVTYNEKLLAESGLPDLSKLYAQGNWNWQTFTEVAQKTTVSTAPGKYTKIGIGSYNSYQSVLPYIRGMGGDLFNEADSVPTLTKPETIKGLEYANDLMNNKHVLTIMGDSIGDFVKGKIAMLTWWDSISTPIIEYLKAKFPINQVPFPAGPVNAKDIHGEFHSVVMTRQSKAKDASWKFMKYLTGKDAVEDLAVALRYFAPRNDTLKTYKAQWNRIGCTGTAQHLEEAMARTDVEPRYVSMSLVYGKLDEQLNKIWQRKAAPSAAMTEAQKYIETVVKQKKK